MEINFPQLEKKILEFWKGDKTFEKSIKLRKKASNFVFYEGPPTANGKPGIHHVLARTFKDIICRYKTMRGFKVERKAGWDTHGLPVELEVEKKLGLKNKKEIEKYGIEEFNKKCKESVWEYKKNWEQLTERIGYWVDMDNPYITYENGYIETVWWILKNIWDKGLLYQGYKVVPYCPRCGTSLSSHEVALGYKKTKENAIYVKFKLLNPEYKNTSLLVWTTTPWTLPGNVAVAVNPEFTYSQIKNGQEYFILAKERTQALGLEGEVIKEIKGKDLVGLRYEPFYLLDDDHLKSAYKVIPGDFVSLEEGTGLVHIAPAFGEDDMEVIKKQNKELKTKNEPEFPILLTVDEEGKFTPDVKKWAGLFVKTADPLIIEDLKSRNILFKDELYEHDYPFCWRCGSPLLYYAKKSWFIETTKIKKDLIENNEKINWVPANLKEGRFGEWLRGIKDWALSRERYWGTPLPIWQCKNCGKQEIIGSKKDLISQKFSQNNYFIVRHGQALSNIKKVCACYPEKFKNPLTKKGEEQIREVALKLKNKKIDFIFSSDLLRMKQTAAIIGKELGVDPIFDKRLREVDVGILNGKPIEKAGLFWDTKAELSPAEYYQKRFEIAPKNGENYVDIEKRMYGFLAETDKKYKNKNILIVGHQRAITLLEKIVYGQDMKELVEIIIEKKEIKNGEIRSSKFTKLPYDKKMELDFHRPYIDEVKFLCSKCGNLMERAKEVIDCWFDSGSMPFAQYHYPFENKDLIDKNKQFPADYISEAIDQTRGWFYTLHAISTFIKNSPAYKNVISLGHVLDEKGEKMSKSKGNIVDPWYIVEKYGADAARWYFYTINQPGDSKLFTERDVDGCLKRFIMIFWNCVVFFETYGDNSKSLIVNPKNILDKWIVSKLNHLIAAVSENLEEYDITSSARLIENFTVNDLSQWYVRRSRPRFQKPKTKQDLKEASAVFRFVILTLSKLIAPFMPFISEEVYRKIGRKSGSIHLSDWPEVDKKLIDKELEEKMEEIRRIVVMALAERAKAGIKVRQPLSNLKIRGNKLKNDKELLALIKDEINVKEIAFDSGITGEVDLDIKITPELKEEGTIREVIRYIQEMRKKSKLRPQDKILVRYSSGSDLKEVLERNKDNILREGKIKDFKFGEKKEKGFNISEEVKVDNSQLWLAIKKI
ncbi:MAG: class I tRNA ligase family protein [Candidatus Paceibacterota bacterium]